MKLALVAHAAHGTCSRTALLPFTLPQATALLADCALVPPVAAAQSLCAWAMASAPAETRHPRSRSFQQLRTASVSSSSLAGPAWTRQEGRDPPLVHRVGEALWVAARVALLALAWQAGSKDLELTMSSNVGQRGPSTHVNVAFGRSPHNPGFQTVIFCRVPPDMALVRMDRAHTRGNPAK